MIALLAEIFSFSWLPTWVVWAVLGVAGWVVVAFGTALVVVRVIRVRDRRHAAARAAREAAEEEAAFARFVLDDVRED